MHPLEVTAELWILDKTPRSSAQTSYAVLAAWIDFLKCHLSPD